MKDVNRKDCAYLVSRITLVKELDYYIKIPEALKIGKAARKILNN